MIPGRDLAEIETSYFFATMAKLFRKPMTMGEDAMMVREPYKVKDIEFECSDGINLHPGSTTGGMTLWLGRRSFYQSADNGDDNNDSQILYPVITGFVAENQTLMLQSLTLKFTSSATVRRSTMRKRIK